jgi:hypothetical protein
VASRISITEITSGCGSFISAFARLRQTPLAELPHFEPDVDAQDLGELLAFAIRYCYSLSLHPSLHAMAPALVRWHKELCRKQKKKLLEL